MMIHTRPKKIFIGWIAIISLYISLIILISLYFTLLVGIPLELFRKKNIIFIKVLNCGSDCLWTNVTNIIAIIVLMQF